jgi:hypothetical protein
MSTRHSIWLGENQGKSVHIYWELAEREIGDGERCELRSTLLPTREMRARKLRFDCRKKLGCGS